MKLKLTAAVLALSMIPQAAFASMSATVGTEKNSIKISGKTDAYNVSVGVLKSGYTMDNVVNGDATMEEAMLYYRPIEVNDGAYSYEVNMPNSAQRGAYTVFSDSESSVVYYASASDRLQMVGEVIQAMSDNTLPAYLETNGVYLTNSEKFMKVEDVAKVSQLASSVLSDETLTAGSVASLEKITESLDLSTVIQLLNESKITSLADVEDVAVDTKLDIKLTQKSLIPASKQGEILARIKGRGINSEADFYNKIEESLFIGIVNESQNLNSAEKRTFFDSNAGYVGLDTSKYNTLPSEKKSAVVNQLSVAKTTTIAAMQAKLDDLYEKEKPATTIPSGGGGGGGGGGGSVVNTTRPALTPSGTEVVATPEEPNYVPTISFADMENYAWAETAVKTLRNNGIVSGYSDGNFKPQGSVTRAEFVTMIVKAFLSEYKGEEAIFADVAAADWSYKYIMAAYENKLVSGMGEGTFLPNENIKRSDMAVILNNLMKLKEKEIAKSDKDFGDSDSIPEYAKDAVGVLRGAGVINGDENNNFRPGDFANRAEAAVMIYRFTELMQEVQE